MKATQSSGTLRSRLATTCSIRHRRCFATDGPADATAGRNVPIGLGHSRSFCGLPRTEVYCATSRVRVVARCGGAAGASGPRARTNGSASDRRTFSWLGMRAKTHRTCRRARAVPRLLGDLPNANRHRQPPRPRWSSKTTSRPSSCSTRASATLPVTSPAASSTSPQWGNEPDGHLPRFVHSLGLRRDAAIADVVSKARSLAHVQN